MSFNRFKPLIQNIQELFFTKIQNEKQRNDEDQECLQFGICAVQTHHLDQKSILVENKSSTMPLQENFQ